MVPNDKVQSRKVFLAENADTLPRVMLHDTFLACRCLILLGDIVRGVLSSHAHLLLFLLHLLYAQAVSSRCVTLSEADFFGVLFLNEAKHSLVMFLKCCRSTSVQKTSDFFDRIRSCWAKVWLDCFNLGLVDYTLFISAQAQNDFFGAHGREIELGCWNASLQQQDGLIIFIISVKNLSFLQVWCIWLDKWLLDVLLLDIRQKVLLGQNTMIKYHANVSVRARFTDLLHFFLCKRYRTVDITVLRRLSGQLRSILRFLCLRIMTESHALHRCWCLLEKWRRQFIK